MSDQKQNEAFKPLTRESGHLDIESRLAERAKNKELWVHLWRKYPELIPARDLMSGLLLSYSTLFPNCYFLPDDEIQFLVEYADLADSIDQIEFYVDLELLFEVKIYDQFTRDTFRHPYHLFLAKLLNLVKADNPSHYLAQKVFDPITYQTKGIEKRIRLRLELRASHPEVWESKWPNEPRLLAVRDLASRIIRRYSKTTWPNVFFLPEDSVKYLIWEEADSLDLVEIVLEFEEAFGIHLPENLINKIIREDISYLEFLEELLKMIDPARDLEGSSYPWQPLCLPPGYHQQSLKVRVKRFLSCDTNNLEHNRLRFVQACRPPAWKEKWPEDTRLIRLRDRVSPILIRELEWLDEAFLPQDRLDALFHSRWGLSRLSNVLGIINYEFGGDIPRDFITSGQHTFEDLLRRLGGIDSKTIQA